ncbi:MAG: potassium channel family protein [Planctomycetota bacterium]
MFELVEVAAAEQVSDWPVIFAAGLVTILCVLLHYEALALAIRVLKRWPLAHHRLMLPLTIIYLLVVHLVEIGLYAVVYWVLTNNVGPDGGELIGAYDGGWSDAAYFSAAVYTTVGFGDITPEGPLRMLVAAEALTGLVLVTWSASFTFLVMQRYWVRGDHMLDDVPPAPPPPGASA